MSFFNLAKLFLLTASPLKVKFYEFINNRCRKRTNIMINIQFKLCWLFQRDEALKRTTGLYKKEKINVSIAISSLSLLVDGAKTVHFRTHKKIYTNNISRNGWRMANWNEYFMKFLFCVRGLCTRVENV